MLAKNHWAIKEEIYIKYERETARNSQRFIFSEGIQIIWFWPQPKIVVRFNWFISLFPFDFVRWDGRWSFILVMILWGWDVFTYHFVMFVYCYNLKICRKIHRFISVFPFDFVRWDGRWSLYYIVCIILVMILWVWDVFAYYFIMFVYCYNLKLS